MGFSFTPTMTKLCERSPLPPSGGAALGIGIYANHFIIAGPERRFLRSASSNLCFPEPHHIRQTIAVTWSRQQIQKEVGIMRIKRPQTFENDMQLPID